MNTNPYLSKNVPIWRDAAQPVVAVEQMLRQLSRYYKYTLGTELPHMNIYVLSHTTHQASYFSGLQRLLEKHRGLSIYNMNNGPLLPKWQNRCLGRFSAQNQPKTNIRKSTMTNQSIILKAAVLMLLSINFVHAEQTITAHITNATLDSRYTVHEPHADGTQTVTDTVTGLMWQQCSVGQTGTDCSGTAASTHTWKEALELAASANVASTAVYSNWRLPNIKELKSIVAFDRYNPSINMVVFPNSPSISYWSSSLSVSDHNAWLVNFYYGNSSDTIARTFSYNVRLVRSPQ